MTAEIHLFLVQISTLFPLACLWTAFLVCLGICTILTIQWLVQRRHS